MRLRLLFIAIGYLPAPFQAFSRHALADIALMLNAKPRLPDPPRLDAEAFSRVWELAEATGLELCDEAKARDRLHELRKAYEPFAASLAGWLELALPSVPLARGGGELAPRDPGAPPPTRP